MKTLHYNSNTPVRLDTFILDEVPTLSFALLQKYLRQNKVKLNGKKAPLATRVARGDEVRLYLPEANAASPPAVPAPTILFEDEGLLALYKPPGLPSLCGEEGPSRDPAQNGIIGGTQDSLLRRAKSYLRQHSPDASALLCHRLDTGTSGVLLVAKNTPVLDFTTNLLRGHQLQKTYYGLTFGHPKPPAGLLDGWLAKDTKSGFVRVVAPGARGAKPAKTQYRTLATTGPLALLHIQPQTGRTHQIRAHLAKAGTPLLGDSKYGDNAANRRYRCRYQCLCGAEIRFPATTGEFARYSKLVITCEKPWFYTQAMAGLFK